MTIYQLKSRFQNILRPAVEKLAARGVTANQVTLAALALSAVCGGLLYLAPHSRVPYLLLPLGLLVRMALNAIDGMLAREYNMKSTLGMYLNELGDIASDFLLYLPWCVVPGATPWLVAVVVLLSVSSEVTGILTQTITKTRRYEGPMGKSDRAFVFGALGLWLGLGLPLGATLINLVFIALALLLGLTIKNRLELSSP